jgi:hypothetical protein
MSSLKRSKTTVRLSLTIFLLSTTSMTGQFSRTTAELLRPLAEVVLKKSVKRGKR